MDLCQNKGMHKVVAGRPVFFLICGRDLCNLKNAFKHRGIRNSMEKKRIKSILKEGGSWTSSK